MIKQKKIKTIMFALFFLLFCVLILLKPNEAFQYASNGLLLWFQNMIPTLFPFMILTGIIINQNYIAFLAPLFHPIFYPLFRLNPKCQFCILIGFLCGFPLGAKICGDLYRLKYITRQEATLLLSFCNNIGPIFLIGFTYAYLADYFSMPVFLFGMYGIPFLYGILLRYTVYKHISFNAYEKVILQKSPPSLATTLDHSISSAIQSITKLGGYIIFFNLWNLIPFLLFEKLPKAYINLRIFSSFLFEVTNAICAAGSSHPLMIVTMLHFGGFSCIAQTYSMISDTDLSIKNYIFHKTIQAILAYSFFHLFI